MTEQIIYAIKNTKNEKASRPDEGLWLEFSRTVSIKIKIITIVLGQIHDRFVNEKLRSSETAKRTPAVHHNLLSCGEIGNEREARTYW